VTVPAVFAGKMYPARKKQIQGCRQAAGVYRQNPLQGGCRFSAVRAEVCRRHGGSLSAYTTEVSACALRNFAAVYDTGLPPYTAEVCPRIRCRDAAVYTGKVRYRFENASITGHFRRVQAAALFHPHTCRDNPYPHNRLRQCRVQ
jgi:hypothetical protein